MSELRDESDDGCPVRCGCGGEWVDCWSCGGECNFDAYEEDPLWYDPGDVIGCDICGQRGGFSVCLTSPAAQTKEGGE